MKRKYAQELAEFLLVAPFLIIIFGILTEYAYALNINLTLNNGLKTVSSGIYAEIRPNSTIQTTQSLMLSKLQTYMIENNAPMNSENNLQLNIAVADDTAILTAAYTYYPAFTLPQIFIHFMPEKFTFHANAIVPGAFLKPNVYSDIDSSTLDKIWSNGGHSTPAMNRSLSANVNDIKFLVPASEDYQYYLIVNFNGTNSGQYLKNSSSSYERYYIYNVSGTSMVKTSTKYNNTSAITFIVDTLDVDVKSDLKTQLSNKYSTKLSDSSVNGIIKMMLAVSNSIDSLSSGNYDNMSITDYNSSIVSTHKTYQIKYNGGQIIVAPSSMTIQNLVDTSSPKGDYT